MKGFFIIYYDDVRGPVLESRLVYMLDPMTRVTEELAEQIFYSLNLKKIEQKFYEFRLGEYEICTFFTSQVRRQDLPVIFNVILEVGESREKYYGFIKKWAEYIYQKMIDGTPFTVNPIILDIERRIETIDIQHALFRLLSSLETWRSLEKIASGKAKQKKRAIPQIEKLKAFGLVGKEGQVTLKDLSRIVDFSINEDFTRVTLDLKESQRLALASKVLDNLKIIRKAYQQVGSSRDLHFLSTDYPHAFFSLFSDSIPYKIFRYMANHSLTTAKEVARALDLDVHDVFDYMEHIAKEHPAFVTYIEGTECYFYKLLLLSLRSPYPISEEKIKLEQVELAKDRRMMKFEGLQWAQPKSKKKKEVEESRREISPELVPAHLTAATPTAAMPTIVTPSTPVINVEEASKAKVTAESQVVTKPAQIAKSAIHEEEILPEIEPLSSSGMQNTPLISEKSLSTSITSNGLTSLQINMASYIIIGVNFGKFALQKKL